jgi:hypothetical protein
VSRDGYFFEGLNSLISTFCVSTDGFPGLAKVFHYPIQLLTFNLLSEKGVPIYYYKPAKKYSSRDTIPLTKQQQLNNVSTHGNSTVLK